MTSGDEVRLAIPAKPELLGLARLTAGGLASRLGFTYDQVEDLRLAMDEMCFALTGSTGRDGTLELHFLLNEASMTIVGQGHFASPGILQRSPISEALLNALVDEHSLTDGTGGPRFSLVKNRPASPSGPPPQPLGKGQ
ncbi:MAG: hypothetical protein ACP5VR_01400 [Acidimicrobiales bacterium]